MVGPNTRSMYGKTKIPIESLKKVELKQPFSKASVIIRISHDRFIAQKVAGGYRAKYLSETSNLDNKQKKVHSDLLSTVENYSKNRSYPDVVSSIGDVKIDDIMSFCQNWLDLEHEMLTKSLEDWKTAAEEELQPPVAPEASEEEKEGEENDVVKRITDLRKYIDKEFRHLSTEIDNLRRSTGSGRYETEGETRLISRPPEETTESLKEELELLARVEPTPSRLPKAKIWSRMWEDEKWRDSARFLGAYLFTAEKTPQAILQVMEAPSTKSLLMLTDEKITEVIGITYAFRGISLEEELKSFLISPIGTLFLQRLDFTPVGYVKGELVYTLPLTPGEKASVSHREWSKTTEEYVKEVEEVFEEEKEKALSETKELTESSSSEKEVEHKAGASVTATGGMGAWSIEASGYYDFRKATATAAELSSTRNQETTSKAASRSKKEHKMSFKVAREVRVEDEQVRIIENRSDEPVRWDFYGMMKKWKIDLYHIGERMTYDIVVPEPGDYFLRKYIELRRLQLEIDRGDPFELTLDQLDDIKLKELAGKFGIKWNPPESIRKTFTDSVERLEKGTIWGTRILNIEFPEGYKIIGRYVTVVWPHQRRGSHYYDSYQNWYRPDGSALALADIPAEYSDDYLYFYPEKTYNMDRIGWFHGCPTPYPWRWKYWWGKNVKLPVPSIVLDVPAFPSEQMRETWKYDVFSKIRDAARAQWLARLEDLQNQRDRLITELMGQDSLKLRQMEREEIMKAILRWVIGPGFQFYPEDLKTLMETLPEEVANGEELEEPIVDPLRYYEETGRLREGLQARVLGYGDMIRFVHHAIEWENVNWILYPYFWTLPTRWDFKHGLDHPDFYHRSFLRAGCARVTLPIRLGWEVKWLEFMENSELPDDYPYLDLATEIKNRAHTAYKYMPDPNREELVQFGEHKDTWYEYTPTGALHIEKGEEPADQ